MRKGLTRQRGSSSRAREDAIDQRGPGGDDTTWVAVLARAHGEAGVVWLGERDGESKDLQRTCTKYFKQETIPESRSEGGTIKDSQQRAHYGVAATEQLGLIGPLSNLVECTSTGRCLWHLLSSSHFRCPWGS